MSPIICRRRVRAKRTICHRNHKDGQSYVQWQASTIMSFNSREQQQLFTRPWDYSVWLKLYVKRQTCSKPSNIWMQPVKTLCQRQRAELLYRNEVNKDKRCFAYLLPNTRCRCVTIAITTGLLGIVINTTPWEQNKTYRSSSSVHPSNIVLSNRHCISKCKRLTNSTTNSQNL